MYEQNECSEYTTGKSRKNNCWYMNKMNIQNTQQENHGIQGLIYEQNKCSKYTTGKSRENKVWYMNNECSE